MKKPKLFIPTKKELHRIGNIVSNNLTDTKAVVAGTTKIQGKKPKKQNLFNQ